MTSSAMPNPWVMSGVCGPPYTSAVSKRLMPASLAASMIAKLIASSVVNPNVMVPNPIRLTMRPDRPKCLYLITSLTSREYGSSASTAVRSWLPSVSHRCQEGGLAGVECVPALVGVNVVGPVGCCTLTPRVRWRGVAPVEAGSGFALGADVRGQVGRAGCECRPAVPSRAGLIAVRGMGFGVGGELPVDHVGQPPLQAAHGFHRGRAGGEFGPVVGAAVGVVA